MDVKLIEKEPNWSTLWCTASFTFFAISRYALGTIVPNTAKAQGGKTAWKWVNIANSLLHSLVTGLGALLCFYLYPHTATDVITTYSLLSHFLISFSIGYFMFDIFDMAMNHRKRSSYELMVHHTFVLSCFMLAAWTRYYLGFGVVALIVEVNSIFLHWRQLLLLQNVVKSNSYYRAISLANLFTFVIFRIVTLCWMTRWLALNRHKLSLPVYSLGCIAMAVLVAMSIVLFLRLLRADFRSKGKEEKDKS